jgi:hypothetical protein
MNELYLNQSPRRNKSSAKETQHIQQVLQKKDHKGLVSSGSSHSPS